VLLHSSGNSDDPARWFPLFSQTSAEIRRASLAWADEGVCPYVKSAS